MAVRDPGMEGDRAPDGANHSERRHSPVPGHIPDNDSNEAEHRDPDTQRVEDFALYWVKFGKICSRHGAHNARCGRWRARGGEYRPSAVPEFGIDLRSVCLVRDIRGWLKRWEEREQRDMDALAHRVQRKPPCIVVTVKPWHQYSDADRRPRLEVRVDGGAAKCLRWGDTALPVSTGPHEVVFSAMGPLRRFAPGMRASVTIDATEDRAVELIYRMPAAPWRRPKVSLSS